MCHVLLALTMLCAVAAGVTRAGSRTLVALSGMHTADRQRCSAILRRLGVSCSSSRRWGGGML